MEKENISYKDLEMIFSDELRIYLSLEKSIFEFMIDYENEPTDILKNIILNLLRNAKDQNHVLLGLISNYFSGKEKVVYSNMLGNKLNNLQEIEDKIKNIKKYDYKK